MMQRWWVGLVLAGMLSTVSASGQISSDQVPRQRTIPIRDSVKAQIENSRYHLGPMRVTPRFGLHSNAFSYLTPQGDDSDLAVTASVGIQTVTPFGRKMFVLADALPEYTFYARSSELNRGGQVLKASLLGLFNRLSTEISGQESNTLLLANSEVERPAVGKRSGGLASLEVDVLERLSILGGVETSKVRFDGRDLTGVPNSNVERLDRHENAFRAGVRYKFTRSIDISVQGEKTRAEFDFDPEARDNRGTTYLLGMRFDRRRFFANVVAGRRRQEPFHSSSFPGFSGTTGSYYANYTLSKTSADVYGDRNLIYSVNAPYFIETMNGAGVNFQTGYRLFFRLYGELGNNSYPRGVLQTNDAVARRSDDVTRYGVGVGIHMFRKAALTIVTTKTTYHSNVDSFDRDTVQTTVGLSFSGGFSFTGGYNQ